MNGPFPPIDSDAPRRDWTLQKVEVLFDLSRELQAPCFLTGANSIFTGGRVLTTINPGKTADEALLADRKMKPIVGPSGHILRRARREVAA